MCILRFIGTLNTCPQVWQKTTLGSISADLKRLAFGTLWFGTAVRFICLWNIGWEMYLLSQGKLDIRTQRIANAVLHWVLVLLQVLLLLLMLPFLMGSMTKTRQPRARLYWSRERTFEDGSVQESGRSLAGLFKRADVRWRVCSRERTFVGGSVQESGRSKTGLFKRADVRWRVCSRERTFVDGSVQESGRSLTGLFKRADVRWWVCSRERTFVDGSVQESGRSLTGLFKRADVRWRVCSRERTFVDGSVQESGRSLMGLLLYTLKRTLLQLFVDKFIYIQRKWTM